MLCLQLIVESSPQQLRTSRCSSADTKVKELEQDAYDGRRPSYNAAAPPLHDEPGAYVPQVPQHMPWLMQLPRCCQPLQPSCGGSEG